jgi:transposase
MHPEIAIVWADSAYTGKLVTWAKTYLDITIKTVRRPPDAKGFVVLPRRRVVERSWSWIMRARRHCRDHERLPEMSESLITWAAITMMTRRLTRRTARLAEQRDVPLTTGTGSLTRSGQGDRGQRCIHLRAGIGLGNVERPWDVPSERKEHTVPARGRTRKCLPQNRPWHLSHVNCAGRSQYARHSLSLQSWYRPRAPMLRGENLSDPWVEHPRC